MSVVFDCTDWFEKARPEPTERDKQSQLGAYFEESAELAKALGLTELSHSLNYYAIQFYEGRCLSIKEENRIEALDAICDIAVTLTGVAHHHKMDFENAWNEVNRSNNSKFENGKPLKNEYGKIIKGKDYTPPDLTPFI